MNIHGGRMTITLYSQKGFKLLWYERQTDRKQTTILTHNFFSWPYHNVLSSRPLLATLLLLGQKYSTRGHSKWLKGGSWLKTHTDSVGICIYHFIMPTTSNKPHHCFCLFTQVHPVQKNLWSMARSKVNIQQCDSKVLWLTPCIIHCVHKSISDPLCGMVIYFSCNQELDKISILSFHLNSEKKLSYR